MIEVLILTEGGGHLGDTHIARSLAISEAFRARGCRVALTIDVAGVVDHLLGAQVFERRAWVHDLETTAATARRYDVVVVDSCRADTEFYTCLEEIPVTMLRLDETASASSVVDVTSASPLVTGCLARALQRLLSVRRAARTDCQVIFEISNQAEVRQASCSAEPILFADHVTWFMEQLQHPDVLFLVADVRQKAVGQIRFSIEGRFATVSISVSSVLRGAGVARLLMREGLTRLRQGFPAVVEVQAFIKTDNRTSINYFEGKGYVFGKYAQVKGCEGCLYTFDLS